MREYYYRDLSSGSLFGILVSTMKNNHVEKKQLIIYILKVFTYKTRNALLLQNERNLNIFPHFRT